MKMIENNEFDTEHVVLMGVLIAFCVVSTTFLASLPGVSITPFIIITATIIFGRRFGIIMGVLIPVVTGLFLSLGIWTLFQMISYGLMAFSAGILLNLMREPLQPKSSIIRAGFGFIWGFLIGWITNLSMFMFVPLTLNSLIMTYSMGFIYDLILAVTNAVLLVALYPFFDRKFRRVKENISY
ncbi:MAG: ECF transporter S component [Methanobrevibacter sp.]|nr:ECF transporter S component [Candidatus Methanovirga australis]